MKKTMRLWDIILMNVTAIIGLRWLPIAASYGAASIILWILAALLFFIPTGLVSAELATTWPEQGGMYVWVKKAYGEKWGFITSWFYWINNLFYYPSLLTFVAVTLSYIINPSLKENKLYIIAVTLIVFWIVTLINIKGTSFGKWLSNFGGLFGTLLPGIILIILGLIALFTRPIPTDYSLTNWIPNLNKMSNIAFLSTLMFAMAGIELTPILAGETENPQKTFPLATVISAFIIAGIYIIGTVAITFIISPEKIGAASGIMQAVELISKEINLSFLVPLFVITILIGSLGGIGVWVLGPIKMLFESTKEGIFPEFFTKLNKYDMPQNAMISQAILVSLIIISTTFLPTVEIIYAVLVLMTTITYFIPYLFMFSSFITLRKKYKDITRPFMIPGNKVLPYLVAIIGFLSVMLAIVLSFIPPSDLKTMKDIVIYEIEVIGGPFILGFIGYLLYIRYEKKEIRKHNS
ncbi:amino acid/polyamine/organocation transporter, APC superfamily [Thermoanaerobacter uzonensis DSM 18761]|uniref:Amino acid/polyamine/organocation transporter, APC superfamily n=1 Tax=Thermoanaerobacter uzonensis DSM 18761 TaxID=1123369 RepID=A0A1M4SNS8_9THEO|nr:amino acid permease [Thermoanaerobacter uzonensis]SHE33819.1 amino acid/polyamine/organocation transporter, APC superfamily [Thermoanaerobacter uzonensis DSM 18761]